ncbi:hypothetical protein H312_03276 [Anncaliia algerae PRA339]|uniref:Uncharacterized protein n=1 Tax=Anncaliia algerae PRA339 TaxID=1288291 RepID=A0A059EWB5_9MICR|nr:hypothetical protein H312_03276 [Anncaliia algerae PRA339]
MIYFFLFRYVFLSQQENCFYSVYHSNGEFLGYFSKTGLSEIAKSKTPHIELSTIMPYQIVIMFDHSFTSKQIGEANIVYQASSSSEIFQAKCGVSQINTEAHINSLNPVPFEMVFVPTEAENASNATASDLPLSGINYINNQTIHAQLCALNDMQLSNPQFKNAQTENVPYMCSSEALPPEYQCDDEKKEAAVSEADRISINQLQTIDSYSPHQMYCPVKQVNPYAHQEDQMILFDTQQISTAYPWENIAGIEEIKESHGIYLQQTPCSDQQINIHNSQPNQTDLDKVMLVYSNNPQVNQLQIDTYDPQHNEICSSRFNQNNDPNYMQHQCETQEAGLDLNPQEYETNAQYLANSVEVQQFRAFYPLQNQASINQQPTGTLQYLQQDQPIYLHDQDLQNNLHANTLNKFPNPHIFNTQMHDFQYHYPQQIVNAIEPLQTLNLQDMQQSQMFSMHGNQNISDGSHPIYFVYNQLPQYQAHINQHNDRILSETHQMNSHNPQQNPIMLKDFQQFVPHSGQHSIDMNSKNPTEQFSEVLSSQNLASMPTNKYPVNGNIQTNSSEKCSYSNFLSKKTLKYTFPRDYLTNPAYKKDICVEYHANRNDVKKSFMKQKITKSCLTCCNGSNKSLCTVIHIARNIIENLFEHFLMEIEVNEFKARLKSYIISDLPDIHEIWNMQVIDQNINFVFRELNYSLLNIAFFFINFVYRLEEKEIYLDDTLRESTSIDVFTFLEDGSKLELISSMLSSLSTWKILTIKCETLRDFLETTFDVIIRKFYVVKSEHNETLGFFGFYESKVFASLRFLLNEKIE